MTLSPVLTVDPPCNTGSTLDKVNLPKVTASVPPCRCKPYMRQCRTCASSTRSLQEVVAR